MKITPSNHAWARFTERFPKLRLEDEFESAVPCGVQLGIASYRLSKNDVVFVIEENTIVTCLTVDQANVNIQKLKSSHLYSSFITPNKPIKTPPKVKGMWVSDDEKLIAKILKEANDKELSRKDENSLLRENGFYPEKGEDGNLIKRVREQLNLPDKMDAQRAKNPPKWLISSKNST